MLINTLTYFDYFSHIHAFLGVSSSPLSHIQNVISSWDSLPFFWLSFNLTYYLSEMLQILMWFPFLNCYLGSVYKTRACWDIVKVFFKGKPNHVPISTSLPVWDTSMSMLPCVVSSAAYPLPAVTHLYNVCSQVYWLCSRVRHLCEEITENLCSRWNMLLFCEES